MFSLINKQKKQPDFNVLKRKPEEEEIHEDLEKSSKKMKVESKNYIDIAYAMENDFANNLSDDIFRKTILSINNSRKEGFASYGSSSRKNLPVVETSTTNSLPIKSKLFGKINNITKKI